MSKTCITVSDRCTNCSLSEVCKDIVRNKGKEKWRPKSSETEKQKQ